MFVSATVQPKVLSVVSDYMKSSPTL